MIELLIVIAILSILAVGGIGQYYNSLKSGKDARRKADLQSIQKGLELYYEDYKTYPSPVANAIPDTGGSFCHPSGCATVTYLKAIPTDQGTPYYYISNGTSYQLYSCIENPNDEGLGVKQSGYGVSCGTGRCNPCRYGVSSTNSTP